MKKVYFLLAMSAGLFMLVYGGIDDSPGGQLIGLLLIIIGVVCLIKKKFSKS